MVKLTDSQRERLFMEIHQIQRGIFQHTDGKPFITKRTYDLLMDAIPNLSRSEKVQQTLKDWVNDPTNVDVVGYKDGVYYNISLVKQVKLRLVDVSNIKNYPCTYVMTEQIVSDYEQPIITVTPNLYVLPETDPSIVKTSSLYWDLRKRTKDVLTDQFSRNQVTESLELVLDDVATGKLDINPFYQRGLVWTLEQKQAFIENLFKEKTQLKAVILLKQGKRELLDGKQRLSAICEFINNDFPIFVGQPHETDFNGLSIVDKIKFINQQSTNEWIRKYGSEPITNAECVELFLEINDYGTSVETELLESLKETYLNTKVGNE